MACQAVEQVNIARPSALERVLTVLSKVVPGRAESAPRLDLEEMSDRLKRDLGFLDGREPYCEDRRVR
ncbi:hypothetical protein [Rhizobium sp. BK602]|uniref:hypothetical protein n=1 Tax=Rhizobium sp. BK602 TaxID=2586986 RepID=UPI0017FE0630|nr:hypothetical protein [Rhizobium sp. BK602]MBB3607141.1 hypothetical protein [Rhizobium sp. BK602]